MQRKWNEFVQKCLEKAGNLTKFFHTWNFQDTKTSTNNSQQKQTSISHFIINTKSKQIKKNILTFLIGFLKSIVDWIGWWIELNCELRSQCLLASQYLIQ